jgi:hypothetical protein
MREGQWRSRDAFRPEGPLIEPEPGDFRRELRCRPRGEFWSITGYNLVMSFMQKQIWARQGGRDGFDA